MKKLCRIAAVLFAAAVLFTGCSSPNGGGGGGSAGSAEPLFNESELDVTLNPGEFQLTDGTYSFKSIRTANDDNQTSIEQYEFTVSNGVLTLTKAYETHSGPIPSNVTSAQIEEAKANGYVINGNTYSYTEELTGHHFEEAKSEITVSYVTGSFNNGAKTNSAKTKFFAKDSNSYFTGKCYLEKKSGSSSSNNNTQQGGTDSEDLWKVVYNGTTLDYDLTEDDLWECVDMYGLEEGDFTVDLSTNTVTLEPSGFAKVEAYEEEGGGNSSEETYYTVFTEDGEYDEWPASDVARMIAAAGLELDTDYFIDEEYKEIYLTDEGFDKVLDYKATLR